MNWTGGGKFGNNINRRQSNIGQMRHSLSYKTGRRENQAKHHFTLVTKSVFVNVLFLATDLFEIHIHIYKEKCGWGDM